MPFFARTLTAWLLVAPLAAEARPASGRVVSRRGEPLPCVVLGPGDATAQCSAGGDFLIEVPEGPVELSVGAEGHRGRRVVVGADGLVGTVVLPVGRAGQTVVTHLIPLRRGQSAYAGEIVRARGDFLGAPGTYGDPVRALHDAAGVVADTKNASRFAWMGAGPDDVGVEIDSVPVRGGAHFGSVFSVVDPVSVAELTLAAAPSAQEIDALGGRLGVALRDDVGATGDKAAAAIDLSVLGGSGRVGFSSTEDTAITLSVRRSFLSAYLAGFAAAGALDVPVRTVDFGSAALRARVRRGPVSIDATVLELDDRLLLDDVNTAHRVLGGSLRVDVNPVDGLVELSVLCVPSWERVAEPRVSGFDYPGKRWFRVDDGGLRVRATMRGRPIGVHEIAGGVDLLVARRTLRGRFDDRNEIPPFAALPNADLLVRTWEADVVDDRSSVAGFAEHGVESSAGSSRGGVRLQWDALTGRVTASPRLLLVVRPPRAPELSLALAVLHRPPDRDGPRGTAFRTLPDRPSRSALAVLAVRQPLGPLAVALSGYGRMLDGLAVPGPAGPLADGSGRAAGFSTRLTAGTGRVEAELGFDLAGSQRRIAAGSWRDAPLDRRLAGRTTVRLALGRLRNFVVGAGWEGQSGWPVADLRPHPVGSAAPGTIDWAWTVEEHSPDRLAAAHSVFLRAVHRIPLPGAVLTGTAEVDADFGERGYTLNCPGRTDGRVPVCERSEFLPPVRPWIGLGIEW